MRRLILIGLLAGLFAMPPAAAQPQFELTNNFIANLSFVTGTNRGVSQNLKDNFAWMQSQGYTHLRFFGIFPNGVHCFPSATLDAHGFPRSAYHESLLAAMVPEAAAHGITINFDGWEVIVESNRDTTALGVGYITSEELASIVADVLTLGVMLISEEQFGSPYLQTIDSVCTAYGAAHETTAGIWWTRDDIADQQLASVFSFYPYNQAEADSIIAASSLPANLGNVHIWLEGARYYGIPISLAVGSFGSMATENWKNVCRFAQIQHHPDRFSVEETNWDYLIWDHTFNFMTDLGSDLIAFADRAFGPRPIANLVIDPSTIPGASSIPAYMALLVDGPAIAGTFTALGYRVVSTVGAVLPDADAYYLLLLGGADETNIAPLPGYVEPLLAGEKPVYVQPTFGIPDATDGAGWAPVRAFFGLPAGETVSLGSSIPETVQSGGFTVRWKGADYLLVPIHEQIPGDAIDTSVARVVQRAWIGSDSIALIVQRDNKFLINSNLLHLESSYILSGLLAGPLNRPATADVAYDTGKVVIFAEHECTVDINIPWSGRTQQIRYGATGDLTLDTEADLKGRYETALAEGELVLLFRVTGICGDADDDQAITAADLVFLVAYLFRSGPPPLYPDMADVNASGSITAADVIYLVNYVFKSGPAPACP